MPVRIYLVEDEKSLNLLLQKYLQKEGYEVITFLDGKSAIERIDDMPDLWISDIMLPDILGYELAKNIKQRNSNTPVIFMSARNEEFNQVDLKMICDDFLAKPFLPKELVKRVKNLLKNRKIDGTIEPVKTSEKMLEYDIIIDERTVFLENTKEVEKENGEIKY